MAFLKFRKSSDEPPTAPPKQPESLEAIRTRAKHRLVGAAVLVGLGVIGLPLLFDHQPRPVALDLPIDIPAQAQPVAAQPPTAGVAKPPEVLLPAPAPLQAESPAAIPAATPVIPPIAAPAAPLAPQPAAPSVDGAAAELPPVQDSSKNKTAAPPSGSRFVVQVGAFADDAAARETRTKLEKAGLKTYTQTVQTKEGQRIRVRVGPFALKAQALEAEQKIKALKLPAFVLAL